MTDRFLTRDELPRLTYTSWWADAPPQNFTARAQQEWLRMRLDKIHGRPSLIPYLSVETAPEYRKGRSRKGLED